MHTKTASGSDNAFTPLLSQPLMVQLIGSAFRFLASILADIAPAGGALFPFRRMFGNSPIGRGIFDV